MLLCGSGFSNIYPKENINLYNEILKQNGTVITEYSNEVEPDKTTFPRRNRIISGLSEGVLVIEAGYRSGTTITAKIAKEQGKPVFCIPNNIDSKYGIGTNYLIKNGAKLITSSEDIIEYFSYLKLRKNKLNIKEEYKQIYNIIKKEPINIHNIVIKSGKPISKINEILTMMVLDELIVELPGKEYKIIE